MKNNFNIEIDHGGELMSFNAKPLSDAKVRSYEISNSGVYYMTLECCTDKVGDSSKLAEKDAERHIDPAIVLKVSEVIESEKE